MEDVILPRPVGPKQKEREIDRLRTLYDYHILDTEREISFDRLTKLAADICNAPMALISLIDKDRQWFKSCFGLEIAETSRDVSFCEHALFRSEPLVIPDARQDDRFRDNPLVIGDPHIRFYAGAPLRADNGDILGTLCVLDTKPRSEFSAKYVEQLSDLAGLVMTAIDLHRTLAERDEASALLHQALSFTKMAVWKFDTQNDALEWDGACDDVWGADSRTSLTSGTAAFRRIHPDDVEQVRADVARATAEHQPFVGEFRILHPEKGTRWLAGRGDSKSGRQRHLLIGVSYDITDQHDNQEQARLLLRELHHRMRNLFATVGAIISLTRHSARDVDDYAERIGNRLDALGRAQNVLLGSNFFAGSMHALLDEVQTAFPRIHWSGPDLILPENGLVALALVFNELATNATKYGALSTESGRVDIRWDQDGQNITDRQFRLVWTEISDRPVAGTPHSSGFGTLLMDRSVANNLGGTIDRDWAANGLVCTITMPARWAEG